MKLPTWNECMLKLDSGKDLDPIETFVFEYEPVPAHADRWRATLENAINSAQNIPAIAEIGEA